MYSHGRPSAVPRAMGWTGPVAGWPSGPEGTGGAVGPVGAPTLGGEVKRSHSARPTGVSGAATATISTSATVPAARSCRRRPLRRAAPAPGGRAWLAARSTAADQRGSKRLAGTEPVRVGVLLGGEAAKERR